MTQPSHPAASPTGDRPVADPTGDAGAVAGHGGPDPAGDVRAGTGHGGPGHPEPRPAALAGPDEPVEYELPDDDGADWGALGDGGEPRETLPERPRRRLVTPATLVLTGVVLAGAGFIGGVEVQKGSADDGGGASAGGGRAAMLAAAGGPAGGGMPGAAGAGDAAPSGAAGAGGTPGAGSATPGGAAGTAGAGSAAGGGTAGGAASGTTAGEVSSVKGSKLYVTGTDGTTVEVTVGRQATVQRTAKSTAGGVHPGDTVVVQGTAGSDGSIAATTVQASASGVTLGGLGFGRGGAAAGGAGAPSSGSGRSSGSGGDAVDQLFEGGG